MMSTYSDFARTPLTERTKYGIHQRMFTPYEIDTRELELLNEQQVDEQTRRNKEASMPMWKRIGYVECLHNTRESGKCEDCGHRLKPSICNHLPDDPDVTQCQFCV